jgi:hypothetical protein
MVSLAAVILLSTLKAMPLPPADAPTPVIDARQHHVRATDARVREWLRVGAAGSRTFNILLDRLAASDLIVYVRVVDRIPGGAQGQLAFMTATSTVRYVRIDLVPDGSTAVMVALLGHELQHAVEIADAPRVRDSQSMAVLYLLIEGIHTKGTRYDTVAARVTGDRVKDELASYRESSRPPSPRTAEPPNSRIPEP